MQESLLDNIKELSWLDLLLECIEVGMSPSEVQQFIKESASRAKQV
ncbi:hypothetical protein [Bacillus sp. EAC]|nr:hypothetical protein [Bacillus sp. EAC]